MNSTIKAFTRLPAVYTFFGKTFLTCPAQCLEDYNLCRSLFFTECNVDICKVSQEEFSSIIEDTCGDHIFLWESVYHGNQGTLLDANTLIVQEIYEHFHLKANPSFHQLCDHLSFELLFAGHLSSLFSKGTEEYPNGLLYYLRNYIKNHVLFLVSNVWPHTYGYYKEWLIFLEQELREHLTAIDTLLGPVKYTKDELAEILSEGIKEFMGAGEPYGFIRTDAANVCNRVFHSSGRNNCGGRCVINVHEKKGNILRLSSVSDKTNCPKACVRGYGYRQTNLSPERLRYPLKRVGERGEGRFVRVTWQEAIDTITSEIKRITKIYGPESRYVNYASGVNAMIRPNLMATRLFSLDGGFLDSYNSYSSACTDIATPYTYGTGYTGSSSHFFGQSKLIILWGHNPSETIFGSELLKELLKAKKNGCKIISIDPRFSDTTAAFADRWIGIKPSTDSALTDAMAYVILSEGLEDRDFMDTFCLGFDEDHMPEGIPCGESYESYLFGKKDGIVKNPEWAETITGIPKDTIISLSRAYATSKPAALVQGLGPQRTCNGEQTARSSTLLPCLTGNVGIPGGYAGGNGFIQLRPMPVIHSLPNPYPAVIPSFLWTDAVVRGKDMTQTDDMIRGAERLKSPVKLIFNLAGNTLINQHSDVNKTAQILKDTSLCEFIVVSDLFMTPSAKFADILLPGTSFLESENITYPWREGDFFLYNPKVIDPLFESRFEYDWLKELAANLGVYEEFTAGKDTVLDWVKAAYEDCKKNEAALLPPFAEFSEGGGYFYKEPSNFIAFQKQIEDFEHNPFSTPSGKIEIFSKALYDFHKPEEIPAIPKYIEGFEGPLDPLTKKYPLQLIGWHTKRRCHSTHDNNPWMEEIEPPRVWINPTDAQNRNIEDGQLTKIFNDRGTIHMKAHVTNRIIPGVIAISQGVWYTPDKDGTDIRGNINTLTTLRPTPLAKGNPQHTNLADIKGL